MGQDQGKGKVMGVDPASSDARPSAVAVLESSLRLVELSSLRTDEEIIALAQRLRPSVIAIDAPLFLPKGLCCLEESCPCQQVHPDKGRRAERALSRWGIGPFYVVKKTFIKKLIYRGVALKAALEGRGFAIIEVYPYASKVRLGFGPLPKKNTKEGLAALRQRLTSLLPHLEPWLPGLSHDLCDALVAAYTGHLFLRGQTEAVGAPEEGYLYLPQVR